MSKNETTLSVITTTELEKMVGSKDRMALQQHQTSTEEALKNGRLKFHSDQDSVKYSHPDNNHVTHGVPETLEKRLELLQDRIVKSASLGFWLHDSEFEVAKRFRDKQVIPMLDERLEPNWKVKMILDQNHGSRMRFFIAKTALGLFHPDHGKDTAVVERRTFAAFGTDGSLPRPTDMNHALGISERHPMDARDVVIAPTSTSFYAFKPDSSELL